MSIKTLSKKMLAIVAAGAMTMGLAMPTSVFAADEGTTTKVTEAYICSDDRSLRCSTDGIRCFQTQKITEIIL